MIMDRHEYYEEVNSIAAGLVEEARGGNLVTREDFDTSMWETIDGHSFVIYTADAQSVCQISSNDNYSANNFGPESSVDEHGHIKWESIAFGALYADVQKALFDTDDFDPNDTDTWVLEEDDDDDD